RERRLGVPPKEERGLRRAIAGHPLERAACPELGEQCNGGAAEARADLQDLAAGEPRRRRARGLSIGERVIAVRVVEVGGPEPGAEEERARGLHLTAGA